MHEKPKILIVDDKVENLIALEKTLADLDAECVRATSGNDALALILDNEFALALVDVQMPEMDGYETVELIHQNRGTENLLVIFVSAVWQDDYHLIKGIEAGAVDFIAKPIVPEILRGKVRAFLKLYEQRKKIIEAMEVKSQFLSAVSHELRTPLTAIKEGIRLVYSGVTGEINDEQKMFLEIAKRNVDRLARLINDVLDFQQLDANKMKFTMRENDINEVVSDISETMSSVAEAKGLRLVINLDKTLPIIHFDRDKILQVLTNLVNNAVKFTEKGTIAITTTRSENIIQVSIKDTGQGIKEDEVPKLFKEFGQLATGKERETGSTGLGLVISKEIVEKHNGRIWVESEYGQGATFIFILPIDERRVTH
ncbi:MAG: hybrid sensor histidine kinase/response regulator [Candidatus Scalindua sp. AMX11]|nr:MAG: hybrid sensor histidine kinase/response regulator [Candidatus Scalindua sp.]NOG83636.1 hybrid sensor histidine kinase/response regulator [Planctomycetota bacterium]RZV63232.1 MAG: hybrid sensor histidine kinase/response regulator [Candidatus Scalindua sp. SCAELEC01]TDE63411.1 MAG: hybrid sensor histidine kinase/response regulator [Candidatus Scalindua sp. AMX11]GJQ57332.1 MAG: hybrid sensor histidine kinase/response regulator [Candidatus Scalindua sp.]